MSTLSQAAVVERVFSTNSTMFSFSVVSKRHRVVSDAPRTVISAVSRNECLLDYQQFWAKQKKLKINELSENVVWRSLQQEQFTMYLCRRVTRINSFACFTYMCELTRPGRISGHIIFSNRRQVLCWTGGLVKTTVVLFPLQVASFVCCVVLGSAWIMLVNLLCSPFCSDQLFHFKCTSVFSILWGGRDLFTFMFRTCTPRRRRNIQNWPLKMLKSKTQIGPHKK